MSYRKGVRKFGREKDARNAFITSLARSLILKGKIKTTKARAKTLRPYVERLVTKSAKTDLPTRRLLLSKFNNDKFVVSKLIDELGPKYKDRNGGYTRIIKVESRPGSGRDSAIIEFV